MYAARSSRAPLKSTMRLSTRTNIDRVSYLQRISPTKVCFTGPVMQCDPLYHRQQLVQLGANHIKFRVLCTYITRSMSGTNRYVQLTYYHLTSCQPTPLRATLPYVPKQTSLMELSDRVQQGPLTTSVTLTVAFKRVLKFEKVTHRVVFDVRCTCQCELLLQYSERP